MFAGPAMNFVFAFLVYAAPLRRGGRRGAVERAARRRRRRRLAGRAGRPASRRPRARRRRAPDDDAGKRSRRRCATPRARPLALTIERDGAAARDHGDAQAARRPIRCSARTAAQVYLIGIEASHDWQRVGPLQARRHGRRSRRRPPPTWWRRASCSMVQGRVPLRELGGPIAIARAAGAAGARRGALLSSSCSRSSRSTWAC